MADGTWMTRGADEPLTVDRLLRFKQRMDTCGLCGLALKYWSAKAEAGRLVHEQCESPAESS